MKKLFVFLLFLSFNCFSQNILWKNVQKNSVFPSTIMATGYLILENGDQTPNVNLYIDIKNQIIYYNNESTNNIFNIFYNDFSKISLDAYNDGEILRSFEFYGPKSDEILASLRKSLYENAELNILKINSTIKEGFISRSQPKFFINDVGNLDVSNKEIIDSKLLAISPGYIEFIDNTGDIIQQTNKKKASVEGGNDKEKKKQNRKTTRILNIKLGNKYFLNIRELYNHFYQEYENKFYESLEVFKSDFIGKELSYILKNWGPHSEEFVIDDNSKMYVWTFEQKLGENELNTTTAGSSLSNIVKNSETKINFSLSSQYGINTQASKMNLGGYGSIINLYGKINESSYLNWYSSNVTNQYEFITESRISKSTGTTYEVDVSKKIALIVDKNLIIKEILEKNYFSEPYYGVRIKFYK